MNVTDPVQAAENDVRAALHLPGATRGWAPRDQVRLPRGKDERVAWLQAYASALSQAAAQA